MNLSALLFAAPALACWVLFDAVARAGDAPRRASGLWEIAVAVSGQPTPVVGQYCIDAAADDLAVTAGGGIPQKDCSEARTLPKGDGFAIESVCKLGNSTVTSLGVFKGDPAYFDRDLARYYSVTAASLRQTVAHHLTCEGRVTLSIVPRGRADLALPDSTPAAVS